MQDEDFYMSVSKTYHYMNTCAQIKIKNINTYIILEAIPRMLILYFFQILYMLHLDLLEWRFADMTFNAAIEYWQNCGILFFFF